MKTKEEIKRELDLIKGFVEAAEELLKMSEPTPELRAAMLDGFGRDIVACGEALKDYAYDMKTEAVKKTDLRVA